MDHEPLLGSGVERAALAFSILPASCADVVNRRLTIGERARLREGMSRVRDASDRDRVAAIRALAISVARGMEWPRPASHNEADCPFNVVASQPRARVVDVLERMAAREPLEAAVALCHLPAAPRESFWRGLSPEAHAAIVYVLDDVHNVSTVATRAYARDITARLSRERRLSAPSVRV